MEKVEEMRLTIPQNIREALMNYAVVERKRMKNPIIKEMITWKSLANSILKNEVQKRGYFVEERKCLTK